MISISNDCLGGRYGVGSLSLCYIAFIAILMVIKWFPLFVKMWVFSCMICMVGWIVFMSESRLHSFRFIWIKGR
jgi:hypothetical protein